jgi:hypothetical protein
MFQSYEFLEFICYDPNTNEYSWRYKIVDTEFEEVGVALEVGICALEIGAWVGVGVGVVVAVIDTYSKRGLPVVPNLIRALQWYNSKYGHSLEQLIAWQLQYNSKFAQYEQEIKRYLVLL